MPQNPAAIQAFSSFATRSAIPARNCVNDGELAEWLDALASEKLGERRDERAAKIKAWLSTVARRWMLREGDIVDANLEAADPSAQEAQEQRPTWLSRAIAQGAKLSRLAMLAKERRLLADIVDWMISDGGPKMGSDWSKISVRQAASAEEGWVRAAARAALKSASEEAGRQGVETFAEFEPSSAWAGWRWARLTSTAALNWEGALMKHCVGSYADEVEADDVQIYSLRNPLNQPQLTIEARGSSLIQLRAPANEPCPPELMGTLSSFAEAFSKMCEEDENEPSLRVSDELVASGVCIVPGLGLTVAGQPLRGEQEEVFSSKVKLAAQGDAEACGFLEKSLPRLAEAGLPAELARAMPFAAKAESRAKALSLAAEHGHASCVELLIQGPVTAAGIASALAMASRNGSLRCVNALLPNARDDKTAVGLAIGMAAREGGVDVLELLLSVAELGSREVNQALELAAERGRSGCLRLLLQSADPTFDSAQALCVAAKKGFVECVKLLATPESVNASGAAALKAAASRRFVQDNIKCVEVLLPFYGKREATSILTASRVDLASLSWPGIHLDKQPPTMADKLAQKRLDESQCEEPVPNAAASRI